MKNTFRKKHHTFKILETECADLYLVLEQENMQLGRFLLIVKFFKLMAFLSLYTYHRLPSVLRGFIVRKVSVTVLRPYFERN